MTVQAQQGRTSSSTDLFRLDGRVAIVTGAAGLLGEHHATALRDAGAHVVLSDLDVHACEARASQMRAADEGRRVLPVACDVRLPDSWQRLMDAVLAEFGRVDVLVNNAAFTMQTPTASYGASATDCPVDDWQHILDVNLTGVFLGCQTVGRQMLKQREGSIINLASLYGVVSPNHRIYPGTGLNQPVAYAVSKGGVISLTRYLAAAWAEHGVRVNCITPGGVYNAQPELFVERFTQLNPMGRMAQPDELRGALLFLASPASGYCTGHNLVVDGGWTIW